MEAKEVLLKSLEVSQGYLTRALDGLTHDECVYSPGAECNSLAFILWHMTRVEDFYVTRFIKREKTELYEAEGWREKLGTPANEWGKDYNVEQLRAWPAPGLELLLGYADAVRQKTLALIQALTAEKLSEAARPERSPDTIGFILARTATHTALHVGQIEYLRGIQRGLNK